MGPGTSYADFSPVASCRNLGSPDGKAIAQQVALLQLSIRWVIRAEFDSPEMNHNGCANIRHHLKSLPVPSLTGITNLLICAMGYIIGYYSESVQEEILALPATLLARYLALTDRMEVYGANLGYPHTEAFGDGLFELRLKGAEGIARAFYCTLIGKRIVMLHCFIKKTQKTPPGERRIAETRMKEIKNANSR